MKLRVKNEKVVGECKEMSLPACLRQAKQSQTSSIKHPIGGTFLSPSIQIFFLPLLFFIFLNSHFFILHSPFSIQLPALSEGFGTTIDGTGRNITIDGSSCTNCCGFKITSANMIKVL